MPAPLFPGDSYDTPADTPRVFLDRLSLGSRWYFLAGYVHIVLKARALALKGRFDNQAWIALSYQTLKLIEGCGGRVHLRGLDNIRALRGPAVFVSNHMSILETFVFPCLIEPYRHVTFVVKDSLVTGVFGPVMRSRGPIVVGRENPRADLVKVMTEGPKLLAQGTSIVIFPQATRTVDFRPERFNTLGIKLAKAAGVQVVPVAIKTDFWENGRLLKDFGRIRRRKPVHMVFGAPFTVSGSGKEDHERVVQFIAGHLREWQEGAKAGGEGVNPQ
ncbi:MAG: lysophospholipid acyltransferase family protein [Bacteroidota bacterium]